MVKDDLRYVGHMVDCARRNQLHLAGKNRAAYDADEVLRLAVIHLIQTIGEAARLMSTDFQQQHPEVPWPAIVGMRNRVVSSRAGEIRGLPFLSGIASLHATRL
jgi:uncharacterized protein with HEPN domain